MPSPFPTSRAAQAAAIREERTATVEAVMLRGAWDMRTARHLAQQWGVKPQVVRGYYQAVLDQWREQASQQDVDDASNDFLARLHHVQREALEQKAFPAVANLYAVEAKALGLGTQRVEVKHSGSVASEDAVVARLREMVASLSGAELEQLADLEEGGPDAQG